MLLLEDVEPVALVSPVEFGGDGFREVEHERGVPTACHFHFGAHQQVLVSVLAECLQHAIPHRSVRAPLTRDQRGVDQPRQ